MPTPPSALADQIRSATSTRAIRAPRREFRTRKPSGKPSWPITLIAGGKKCGKTYTAVEFSGSDVVGFTYYVEVGEGVVDLYGELPEANFDIVEHDGTFNDILAAIAQAIDQPPVEEGKPNALVVDSVTVIWDMLSSLPWAAAKERWNMLLDLLRTHHGPVILTARLEETLLVTADGKPTGEKEWKIRAEKNLAFEANLVVYIPRVREHWVGGVHSLRLEIPASGFLRYADMTLAQVFEDMGLSNATTAPRRYTPPQHEAAVQAAQGEDRPR